jgi:2-methylcitrate dehydratase MmgE/PrpD-like protein
MGHTTELAQYAAGLRYGDIPRDVVQLCKNAIADTFAIMAFGAALPWSRMIADYAKENGPGGRSRILGTADCVRPPAAALCNGSFAHAFEMDNLTKPNSGSHPGATVFSSTLALAQDKGIGGRELLTAFVAGAEVMIRIGQATKHSNEKHGYHARPAPPDHSAQPRARRVFSGWMPTGRATPSASPPRLRQACWSSRNQAPARWSSGCIWGARAKAASSRRALRRAASRHP